MTILKQNIINMMVWLCVTLFYCYQYILRVLPNIVMPELMNKFGIGASEFGSFAGIYYIGYIAVHIPIGLMLSRIGNKKILPICVLLTSSSLIPMIYSTTWSYVLLGRLLTGIGSSAAIIGALQLLRMIYPNSFTRVLGFTVFFGLITVLYSSGPITKILTIYGIEYVGNFLIILGVILTIITFLLLPKDELGETNESILYDLKSVALNNKIIIVSLLAGLSVGALEGFADAWGSSFFSAVYNIDRVTGGELVGLIFAGMCVGSLLLPYAADKTGAHYGITLLAVLVLSGMMIWLISGHAGCCLQFICIIIGVFSAYQVIIIAKISTFASNRLSGMASAVANMIIMAFGTIFHNSIGKIMSMYWDGVIKDGIPIYSASAYEHGIAIIPGASLISVAGFIIVIIYDRYKVRSNIIKN